MKDIQYAIIGNKREGIFERSTLRLLELLGVCVSSEVFIAPDYMKSGMFFSLHQEQRHKSLWNSLMESVYAKNLTPLFIEEGSFLSLQLAKLDEKMGEYALLSDVLDNNISKIHELSKKRWDSFKAIMCFSPFFSLLKSSDIYKKAYNNLIAQSGAELFLGDFECMSHIKSFNPELAYSLGARVYYDMIDRGVDLVLTTSFAVFEFYEQNHALIKKSGRRDVMDVPLLHISEIFLLMLGENVIPHKIPLGML